MAWAAGDMVTAATLAGGGETGSPHAIADIQAKARTVVAARLRVVGIGVLKWFAENLQTGD
jgi:hypothetical protein